MKTVLAALLSMASTTCAVAQIVFDDVEGYYAAQPGMLFRDTDRRQPEVTFDAKQRRRLEWNVDAAGQRRTVVVEPLALRLAGRALRQSGALRFGTGSAGELGESAGLFVTNGFLCIDGVVRSASGTGVRHRMVYLVVSPFEKRMRLVQLPSLFGTCTGLRLDRDRRLRFDEITYRWPSGADAPEGLTFQEWAIDRDRFVRHGVRMTATFVEPGNVYRMRID